MAVYTLKRKENSIAAMVIDGKLNDTPLTHRIVCFIKLVSEFTTGCEYEIIGRINNIATVDIKSIMF